MCIYRTFSDTVSNEDVGNKFLNLCKVKDICNVPKAICIPNNVIWNMINPESRSKLFDIFSDLSATVSCFLIDAMKAVDTIINNIILSDTIRHQLALAIQMEFLYADSMEFAIRSSGMSEDSENMSFAGIYQSYLHVRGLNNILDAITKCWHSYYSHTAIAARLRNNNFHSELQMAVIIQQMIQARIAGVAFSEKSDIVHIEYVKGDGESLVSGTSSPTSYRSDSKNLDEHQDILDKVIETIQRIKRHLNYEVDMEWAWDENGLHVLQVRPVTSNITGILELKDKPIFFFSRLYLDTELPIGMCLCDCNDVYINYMSKRGFSYRLAEKSNIGNGKGLVFDFNFQGLEENENLITDLIKELKSDKIVIDINNNIRQVIIEKQSLIFYLKETFYSTPSSTQRNSIIIREFIKGKYGMISRIINQNNLLVEYSADGLLEINRGIIECHRIVIKDIHDHLQKYNIEYDSTDIGKSLLEIMPDIISFTKQMNKIKPGTQVEWVVEDNKAYFVDFSVELNDIAQIDNTDSIVISSGMAQGPVWSITDNETLQRLSIGAAISVTGFHEVTQHKKLNELYDLISSMPIKPIIYSDKPYVILSLLFDHVAGFIFKEGSILCHLSILLREAHIPAIICSDYVYNNGDNLIISNGIISLINGSCM